MSDIKDRFMRTVRANLNHLLDNVREFEDRGGFRTFFDPDAQHSPDGFEEIGGQTGRHHSRPPSGSERKTIRDYYANLEVPFDSDLDTVRQAYRRLMKKYHPDNFADDPAREQMATQLSQELSLAYESIKSYLESGRY